MEQSAEKDRVARLLARHRFMASADPMIGFCGGPYCATGLIPVAEHEAHVADVLTGQTSVTPPE